MDNINELISKYNNIRVAISKSEDPNHKIQLQTMLNNISYELRALLEDELKKGNITEDFIKLFSTVDAVSRLDTDDEKEDIILPVKDDKYTLSSNKIISKYTGEEIDLSKMTRIAKIKVIYNHTDIKIDNEDPEIVELCNKGFERFLASCPKEKLASEYGENWQETVEKIYKKTYMETIQGCIDKGIYEVEESNRIRAAKLTQDLEKKETEEKNLIGEIFGLREDITKLESFALKIQQERKEELEKYKGVMLQMAKNNSEDKNRFYSDGTLKPDGNIEPGMYTTHRVDYVNETGMQSRINDINKVHDPLTPEQLNARIEMSGLANVSNEEFSAYQQRNGINEEEIPKTI